jgi:hypothetical protein
LLGGLAFSITTGGPLGQPLKCDDRHDPIERVAAWKSKLPGRLAWASGRGTLAHAWDFVAAGIEVPENARDLQRGWAKPRLV